MDKKYFTNLQRLIYDRETGDIILSNSGLGSSCVALQHEQNEESDCWKINHKFSNSKAIVNIFQSNEDGSFDAIIPDNISYVNDGRIEITFSTPVIGFANILFICDTTDIDIT